jgi:hypothetical protein
VDEPSSRYSVYLGFDFEQDDFIKMPSYYEYIEDLFILYEHFVSRFEVYESILDDTDISFFDSDIDNKSARYWDVIKFISFEDPLHFMKLLKKNAAYNVFEEIFKNSLNTHLFAAREDIDNSINHPWYLRFINYTYIPRKMPREILNDIGAALYGRIIYYDNNQDLSAVLFDESDVILDKLKNSASDIDNKNVKKTKVIEYVAEPDELVEKVDTFPEYFFFDNAL